MNKIIKVVAIFSTSMMSVSAFAADEMKPGLWEMSTTMSAEQLAAMPKDVKLPGLVGNILTSQTCISQKEADNLGLTDDEEDAFCKISNKKTAGTTYSADLTCNGKDKIGTGKSKTVFRDSGNFTATQDFKGTVFGQSAIQHHESVGKWLSANCGSVK